VARRRPASRRPPPRSATRAIFVTRGADRPTFEDIDETGSSGSPMRTRGAHAGSVPRGGLQRVGPIASPGGCGAGYYAKPPQGTSSRRCRGRFRAVGARYVGCGRETVRARACAGRRCHAERTGIEGPCPSKPKVRRTRYDEVDRAPVEAALGAASRGHSTHPLPRRARSTRWDPESAWSGPGGVASVGGAAYGLPGQRAVNVSLDDGPFVVKGGTVSATPDWGHRESTHLRWFTRRGTSSRRWRAALVGRWSGVSHGVGGASRCSIALTGGARTESSWSGKCVRARRGAGR